MGTLRGGKTGSRSTRTWFSSLRNTHTSAHTHAQLWLRGFTSPRPEQRSMLNFDPSHYLARRWGWGWGDNLWTLTPNPGAWAGPCEDNPVCVCVTARLQMCDTQEKGTARVLGGRGRNIFWMLRKKKCSSHRSRRPQKGCRKSAPLSFSDDISLPSRCKHICGSGEILLSLTLF